MKFNAATPWTKNYAARFRPLAQAQADGMLMALFDSLKADDMEINQAVASLCSKWSQDNHPNINDIAREIRSLRGDSGSKTPNSVNTWKVGKMYRTTMVELKSHLNGRPPPETTWDIICCPLDPEQCKELQAYADQRRIAYSKYVPGRPATETVQDFADAYSEEF